MNRARIDGQFNQKNIESSHFTVMTEFKTVEIIIIELGNPAMRTRNSSAIESLNHVKWSE